MNRGEKFKSLKLIGGVMGMLWDGREPDRVDVFVMVTFWECKLCSEYLGDGLSKKLRDNQNIGKNNPGII